MDCIKNDVGQITGKSRLFVTPAFPAGAGPDFVNAIIVVETCLAPVKVLEELHKIEADFGRERLKRWGQRTLDLDLIALGGQIVPDLETFVTWRHLPLADQMERAPEQLILPHPRLQDRAFVLVPMADVAPDWVHPVSGQTVGQMLAALDDADIESVQPLADVA